MDLFFWKKVAGGASGKLRRAQAIEPENIDVYPILAMIPVSNRDFDEAEKVIKKAVSLQPNNSKVLAIAANVAISSGAPERVVVLMKQSMRLCPVFHAWYPGDLAYACFLKGDLENAEEACRTALACDPDYKNAKVTLAMTLAELGRLREARETAKEVVSADPVFSICGYMRGRAFRRKSDAARMVDGLHAAGLPT